VVKDLFLTLEELKELDSYSEDFDSETIGLDEIPITGGRITLTITKGELFIFQGRISFTARLVCARCGEEFEQEFDEEFHREYIFGRDPYDSLPQVELRRQDLDRVYFQDIGIDLKGAIREAVITAIPMAPHCREDCRGVCPICGKNLNYGDCSCPKEGGGGWLEEFLKNKRSD